MRLGRWGVALSIAIILHSLVVLFLALLGMGMGSRVVGQALGVIALFELAAGSICFTGARDARNRAYRNAWESFGLAALLCSSAGVGLPLALLEEPLRMWPVVQAWAVPWALGCAALAVVAHRRERPVESPTPRDHR